MLNGQRYPFIDQTNSTGQISTLPYFPIALSNANNSLEVMALLDTGASVSVIPYEIGIQLNPTQDENWSFGQIKDILS